MAANTETDHVFQEVSVFFLICFGVVEPSNRNNVMDVRVSSEVVPCGPTNRASIVVAFEGLLSNPIPAFAVCLVPATLPVGMTHATKRL